MDDESDLQVELCQSAFWEQEIGHFQSSRCTVIHHCCTSRSTLHTEQNLCRETPMYMYVRSSTTKNYQVSLESCCFSFGITLLRWPMYRRHLIPWMVTVSSPLTHARGFLGLESGLSGTTEFLSQRMLQHAVSFRIHDSIKDTDSGGSIPADSAPYMKCFGLGLFRGFWPSLRQQKRRCVSSCTLSILVGDRRVDSKQHHGMTIQFVQLAACFQ